MRWLHLLAAVAWVGGSLFYVIALLPAAADLTAPVRAAIDRRFRDVVQLAILSLLVTGAVLTFDRLQLQPGAAYAITLGVKVALAIWMFALAQDLASRGRRRTIERRAGLAAAGRAVSTWLMLGLGLAVLLLSDVLKVIGPP